MNPTATATAMTVTAATAVRIDDGPSPAILNLARELITLAHSTQDADHFGRMAGIEWTELAYALLGGARPSLGCFSYDLREVDNLISLDGMDLDGQADRLIALYAQI